LAVREAVSRHPREVAPKSALTPRRRIGEAAGRLAVSAFPIALDFKRVVTARRGQLAGLVEHHVVVGYAAAVLIEPVARIVPIARDGGAGYASIALERTLPGRRAAFGRITLRALILIARDGTQHGVVDLTLFETAAAADERGRLLAHGAARSACTLYA
jgi:hypothetical protein